MKSVVDITPIQNFLSCPTPRAWVEWALCSPEILLIDHANCEHAAAQTAMTMMKRYRYGIPGEANRKKVAGHSGMDSHKLLNKLSRLSREELRHFEQVIAIMKARGIDYPQLKAGRYAGELRKAVRVEEPGRLVDTLLVGSIIEARSCERFAMLAPELDEELGQFYNSLLKSESRHFLDYLKLAEEAADAEEVSERLALLLELERGLVESPDKEFRFHSGVPEG